jgi:hypothetical protein
MRLPVSTMGITVVLAATIMALGYAAIHAIPFSRRADPTCAEHELALLAWGTVGALLITGVGTVAMARFRSPVGGYVLLLLALTLVAGTGFTLGIETHESCGRDSWWKEGALSAGLTFVASVAGLTAGSIVAALAAD